MKMDVKSPNSTTLPNKNISLNLKTSSGESSNLSDKIVSVESKIPSGQQSWGIQSNPSSQNLTEESKHTTPDAEEIPESEVNNLRIQYELEKSMIDMKYKQQKTALEKKSDGTKVNPLTARLMKKV